MFFFIKLSRVYASQTNSLPLCTPLIRCKEKGNKWDIFDNHLGLPFGVQMPQPFGLKNVVSHRAGSVSKAYAQDLTMKNLGLNWTLSPTGSAAYKSINHQTHLKLDAYKVFSSCPY